MMLDPLADLPMPAIHQRPHQQQTSTVNTPRLPDNLVILVAEPSCIREPDEHRNRHLKQRYENLRTASSGLEALVEFFRFSHRFAH